MLKSIWIAMIALPALLAQAPAISAERIRAHDRFLASDLLEGRGVGQRGGDIATEYIATQFALAGAKPAGDNGTYFQKVPLVGHRDPARCHAERHRRRTVRRLQMAGRFRGRQPDPAARHRVRRRRRSSWATASPRRNSIGTISRASTSTAKSCSWFSPTSRPPPTRNSSTAARSPTMAAGSTNMRRRCAAERAASIIIHTNETAGYGWDVVRSSWGRETPFVKLADGQPSLAIAGWMTRDAGAKLLALAGQERRRTAGRVR